MTSPVDSPDAADLNLDAWRGLKAAQQPSWPDQAVLREVAGMLSQLPPLVVADEVDALTTRLGQVAQGEAFLLQGGDCAETFATSSQADIAGKVRVLLQMA
ncbi:MAG: 3-deoxy-7-phosphoheptulonate synthase, partial [Jatrophihabitantaceae bacterium]